MKNTKTTAILLLGVVLGVGPVTGQEREIRGRLRPNETGVPWAGAAIVVMKTGQITCAAADGSFSVSLPAEGENVLQVWPVGFPPTELTVTPADDEMLIPFAAHLVHLEGVVVTAFRESLQAGAPYSRSVLEALELARAPGSLPQKLEGKVPGAAITPNSGAPGGSVQISIRGVRSILGNSEPLIVVDGVPVTGATVGSGTSIVTGSRPEEEERGTRLADLNVQDIANIEVFKGVAASQRYGPRGANGVVAITTRRGRSAEAQVGPNPSLACYRPGG